MKRSLILLAVFGASLCEAGNVRGKVQLMQGRAGSGAVVYLEGGEKSKPLEHALVDQRDRTFIPHISVVTVGTKVSFPNNDTIFHNVFADYQAKKFDFGMYPRGTTKTQVFPRPGVVALMCSVHPDMSAYILVVDTPYFAVADSGGSFTIKSVPDGTYTLKVWHESGQIESKQLRVSGDTVVQISTHRP